MVLWASDVKTGFSIQLANILSELIFRLLFNITTVGHLSFVTHGMLVFSAKYMTGIAVNSAAFQFAPTGLKLGLGLGLMVRIVLGLPWGQVDCEPISLTAPLWRTSSKMPTMCFSVAF